MNKQWEKFIDNIKSTYGKDFVALHEPTFSGQELQYVTDCITSGWVSSVGQYVNQFEEKLAQYTGVKYAISVVNGTAALQVALKAAGVQREDEVFVPSLTFIATANAISYLGAVPHFVDVEASTLGLDPIKLERYIQEIGELREDGLYNKLTGRFIRAVVPMHTFGHSVDLDNLLRVCNLYQLKLVEDAAESLGSFYKGKHTGSFGTISAVSFNGNKIITTGGGGAILTNDEQLARYAKHITTTAKLPHRWEYVHDEIGYNYRMPNLNAALGCAQLEQMPVFIKQKRAITELYKKMVKDLDGVELFEEPVYAESNYWLQTLILDDELIRDDVLTYLNDHGVMSRPIWTPIHQLEMYQNCPRMDLSTTALLNKKIINIPSTPIEVGL